MLRLKIIDAVWEVRNLGVRTFEIGIDTDDKPDEFISAEKDVLTKGAEYIIVKTPVNMPEFIWGLPKLGYTFAEMGFFISLNKKEYIVPPFIERLDRGINVTYITSEADIEDILSKYKGNIFDTDRISIDPFFSKGLSARRYLFWTKDMFNQGCKLFNVVIKDKDIGFYIIKPIDEKTAYPVLAGLYPEYKQKGLGALLIKRCIETVWELGFDKIDTSVVSNNINIIKVNLAFGFKVDNFKYVYVKHV